MDTDVNNNSSLSFKALEKKLLLESTKESIFPNNLGGLPKRNTRRINSDANVFLRKVEITDVGTGEVLNYWYEDQDGNEWELQC